MLVEVLYVVDIESTFVNLLVLVLYEVLFVPVVWFVKLVVYDVFVLLVCAPVLFVNVVW